MTQGLTKLNKKPIKTRHKPVQLKRGARIIPTKKASIQKAQHLQRMLTKSVNEKNEAILAQRAGFSRKLSFIKKTKEKHFINSNKTNKT
ncbi:hypothetical protein T552_03234 [Pneumocystis carinii B80]|uniref:Uncharacterized protein n=1 Tax=Pneumocystis carinii (strain B80) TaxID=1408658 RepID=A0A0W4ZBZ0_PNEC8|nr:hypothetical protein T552_03234 [Pneumocystis carinii B80]KTW25960.1 hypothetical protein T552_03234 [Pneumocystis carinii B80]